MKVNTLENTSENIAELEKLGYIKSPVSKPNGMNKVIRYSIKRGVYWFTNKWTAKKIDNKILQQSVGTLVIF